ncbi:MAG: hypothetical protein M3533_16595 [Actinomycetota bacterium]|nr:hypothetical protein [Actinomycetota bacterium]
MQPTVAFGVLLILISVATLSFAAYALLRGGKGQRGGIGPISERGIHVIAGIRMLVIGLVSLVAGVYLLSS